MSKIVFVINPVSGNLDKDSFRKFATEYCRLHNHECWFVQTSGKDDLQRIIEEVDQRQPDIVVACGGDGTINLVANAIHKRDVIMAIIPLGSANGLATDLNISKNFEQAIELIDEGTVGKLDIILINNAHLSLHLSDIGLNAQLIKYTEENGERGRLKYLKYFFKTIWKHKTFRVTVVSNNRSYTSKAEMVVLANSKKYGTGIMINPEGDYSDGKFEVCIFKPYPIWRVFDLSFRFLSGTIQLSKFMDIQSFSEVTLKLAKPKTLQVDGDIKNKCSEVTAKVLKNQLKVLIGDK